MRGAALVAAQRQQCIKILKEIETTEVSHHIPALSMPNPQVNPKMQSSERLIGFFETCYESNLASLTKVLS